MKNIRTPRTLADATFDVGYAAAHIARRTHWPSVGLAFFVGVSMAFVLAWGLSS